DGSYDVASNTSKDQRNIAIPLGEAFTLTATDPLTGVQTPPITLTVQPPTTSATQDLIFSNTGAVSGTVRRADGGVASTGTVSISAAALPSPLLANINSDGTYNVFDLPAATYSLVALVPHPQGTGITGAGSATVSVGANTGMDVFLQPTGAVTGTLTAANGNIVVGGTVELRGAN